MMVAGGVVLAMVAILAICFHWFTGGTYVSSLPADAQAVARLDMRALKKSGAVLPAGSNLEQMENSGIDFAQPLYAFVDAGNCLGALLPMQDATKWEAYLATQGIKVQKQRGYHWAQDGQWLMAFTNDRCLMAGPLSEQEMGRMRTRMVTLMEQTGKQDNPLLKQVTKSQAPLSAACTTALLHHTLANFAPEASALWTAGDEGMVSMQVDMQDKCIQAHLTLHGTGVEQDSALLVPLTASQVPTLASGQLATVSLGVNGEGLLKKLRQYPTVRTGLIALNFCLDLDMMIRSVHGALTLSIPDADDVRQGALLTAQVRDTRFMQDSGEWAQGLTAGFGVRLTSLADSAFALRWQDYSVCFGVRGHRLMAGTDSQTFVQALEQGSPTQDIGNRLPAGSLMYVQASMPAVVEKASILSLLAGKGEALTSLLSQYDMLTLSVKAEGEMQKEAE